MFKMSCHITVGKYYFDYVADINISSSIETLTDTAVITIPRKLSLDGKYIATGDDRIFNIGDPVEINLGYDNNLKTVFKGYLKDISATVPVTLFCEDNMYLLKKTKIQRSYSQITLNQLLQDILPSGIHYKAVDVSLGKFRINNASVAKVLQEIKTTYGLLSYFKNDVLYSGLAYWTDDRKEASFAFQRNIIQNRLQYKRKDDVRIKIKAISILPDNSRIEAELGDDDGDLRTFHYYNLDKKALEHIVAEEIEKLKYTGYYGSFTTFGEPMMQIGDIAHIVDNQYPERQGKFLIKQVIRQFGVKTGYRQRILLDKAVVA